MASHNENWGRPSGGADFLVDARSACGWQEAENCPKGYADRETADASDKLTSNDPPAPLSGELIGELSDQAPALFSRPWPQFQDRKKRAAARRVS